MQEEILHSYFLFMQKYLHFLYLIKINSFYYIKITNKN